MFNEATFQGMLVPSSGNVNVYVTHIYNKYANLDGNHRTCGGKKLHNAAN